MTSLKVKNVQSNICFLFSNWIKNKNMELKIYASLFHIEFSLENQIILASWSYLVWIECCGLLVNLNV